MWLLTVFLFLRVTEMFSGAVLFALNGSLVQQNLQGIFLWKLKNVIVNETFYLPRNFWKSSQEKCLLKILFENFFSNVALYF